MEINRHNYEHYFLLWVDNELCAKDQKAVDSFIAENPDLAEELILLQEAKLPNDELFLFSYKSSLLKNAQEGIALHNYETYFLMYVDGELNKNEEAEVELFVLQHPQLQAQFLLIQQTKLQPEQLVFENKDVLFRKEKISGSIMYLQWRRMAVAAALIGLAFSVWMMAPTTKLSKRSAIESLMKIQEKSINTNTKPNKTNQIQTLEAASVMNSNVQSAKQNSISNTVSLDASKSNSKPLLNSATDVKNSLSDVSKIDMDVHTNEVTIYNSIASANNTEASENNMGIQELNVNNLQADSHHNTDLTHAEKNSGSPNSDTEIDQANLMKPAVYRELDTDESSSSLYVGSIEINKDKLRGFFRKAGSLFKSKMKLEEEKIDTNK